MYFLSFPESRLSPTHFPLDKRAPTFCIIQIMRKFELDKLREALCLLSSGADGRFDEGFKNPTHKGWGLLNSLTLKHELDKEH